MPAARPGTHWRSRPPSGARHHQREQIELDGRPEGFGALEAPTVSKNNAGDGPWGGIAHPDGKFLDHDQRLEGDDT